MGGSGLTDTDDPQVGHASAHPVLLRQRDHHGFHPAAYSHLRHVQVHPAPACAPLRRPSLHQQAIKENMEGYEADRDCVQIANM